MAPGYGMDLKSILWGAERLINLCRHAWYCGTQLDVGSSRSLARKFTEP